MSISTYLAMGGYAAYVWPAYGASFVGIVGAVVLTLWSWRRTRAELALLESLKEERR